jgi:hypothetical protein
MPLRVGSVAIQLIPHSPFNSPRFAIFFAKVQRGLDKLALQGNYRTGKDPRICPQLSALDLAREFFQGFANEARCNLHLELLYGAEPHHVVEAIFKAFAKAVDFACQLDPRIAGQVPSTKGKL